VRRVIDFYRSFILPDFYLMCRVCAEHAFMARIAAGIAEIPNRKIIDPITMFLHPHGAPASAPAAAAAAASPSAASDSKSKKKGKK
jgi:ribosomal protein L12E/L44/L45/RPP1/RPP2